MGIAMMLVFGACVIGFPSILGVWLVRLYRGTLDEDADIAHPTGIAVGISVVIAACIAAAVSAEAEREFGPWIKNLWVYASMTFLIGLFIGWAEKREPAKKR